MGIFFNSEFKNELNGIRKRIEQKKMELRPKAFISVSHIYGLPISENTNCQLYYCEDKIVIGDATAKDSTTFLLPFDKIKDIIIKTDVEIEKQVVSSIGGAIAGGIILGPLGAVIGGRAKTKTTREIIKYLILAYIGQDSELKNIAFDVTYTPKSNDFVKLFKENKKDRNETIVTL